MPFAGYEDFAECVRKNKDKEDPEAYCGAIENKIKKARKKKKESHPKGNKSHATVKVNTIKLNSYSKK